MVLSGWLSSFVGFKKNSGSKRHSRAGFEGPAICESLEKRTLLSALSVVSQSPVPGSPSTSAETDIVFTFDQNVNPATVNDQTISVHGSLSGQVELPASAISVDGSTITINPASGFLPNEVIQVTVSTDVQNGNGESLDTALVSEFRVAPTTGWGNFELDSTLDTNMLRVVGDFDNDGDVDFVTTDGEVRPTRRGWFTVWFNDGNAGFTQGEQQFETSDFIGRSDMAASDLNGDGHLDLLLVSYGSSQIWLNDGTGGFTRTAEFSVGNDDPSGGDTRVMLGDIDGDGDLDAFFAFSYYQNEVWLNDGNANFTRHAVIGGEAVYGAAMGDIDGDGDLDVVTSRLWINDGLGNFTAGQAGFGDNTSGGKVFGDIDGDGDLDLVVSTFFNGHKIFTNDGSGGFSSPVSQHLPQNETSGKGVIDVTFADIDGDGDLDLLEAAYRSNLNPVWLNNGAGQFEPAAEHLGANGAGQILSADVNGDGAIDVILGKSTPEIWLNVPDPGNEVVTLPSGGVYELRLDGTDAVVTEEGASEVFRMASSRFTSLTVEGTETDDTLIVDYSGGDPIPAEGLFFNGVGQSATGDRLELVGGSAMLVTSAFTNVDAGTINIDGSLITYTGLEQAADELTVVDRVFTFGDADDEFTISDGESTDDGITRIGSGSSSHTVDFSNPSGQLLINAGDGNDTVTASAVDGLFAAQIEVNGQTGDDLITLSDDFPAVSLNGGVGDDTLRGSMNDDTLLGDDGDDVLNGGGGSNELSGGAGHDTLTGGMHDDTLLGDDGDDVLNGGGGNNDLNGGNGHDTLIGGMHDDTLRGGGGDDVLNGRGGNDQLFGGDGVDRMLGGSGRDLVDGGNGSDRLRGQGGSDDTLLGGAGVDMFDGGAGRDWLVGTTNANSVLTDTELHIGSVIESVSGIEMANLSQSTESSIQIDASGFSGHVTLIGGTGNDTLIGGSNDDSLEGGGGNDKLNGGDGHDSLDGGIGNDSLTGVSGHDWLDGGDGDDSLNGGDGDDSLTGGFGDDALAGMGGYDWLNGNRGSDSLLGGDGDDTLLGGGQDDTLLGEAGDDYMKGHEGDDVVTGGGNGEVVSAGDEVIGEMVDDTFMLDMPSTGGDSNDSPDGGSSDDGLVGLSVVSVSPAPGSNTSSSETDIVITFNQSVDPATASSQTVTVHGSLSGQVALPASAISVDGTTITIKPTAEFLPNEIVRVTLTQGIQNDSSETLEAALVSEFRVAPTFGWGNFELESSFGDSWAVQVGDFDNDGDIDLVTHQRFNHRRTEFVSSVWFNDGNGGFTQGTQEFGTGGRAVVGDLNGNGYLDLLLYRESGNQVWLNDGMGQFTQGDVFVTPDDDSFFDGNLIELGDIDGDGDLDAFISFSYGRKEVWLNDGNASFTRHAVNANNDPAYAIVMGDIDGDGDLDTVASRIWINDGIGKFTAGQQITSDNTSTGVVLGDVDGDGDLDLAVARGFRGHQIYENDGSGNFALVATNKLPQNQLGGVGDVILADIDADGDLDLLEADYGTNSSGIWLNNGDGQFEPADSQPGTESTSQIHAVDLNGNGAIDIIYVNSGGVATFFNKPGSLI